MKRRKVEPFAHENTQQRAAHREIDRRYSRKRKGIWPRTFAAIRLSELSRLFEHRYGSALPADEHGETAAIVAVHHLAHLRDSARRISDWLNWWAPWLGLASRERLIEAATSKPLRYRANKLAWKLRVTAEEREGLDIRTIGAIDETKAQRANHARISRRLRQELRRRAHGAKPRKLYEAKAIEHTKPWLSQGISRATWYRRQAKPA